MAILEDDWKNQKQEIVIDEYNKNAHFINEALDEIKYAYLPNS